MKQIATVVLIVMGIVSVATSAEPLMVQGVREVGISAMLDDDGEDLGLTLNGRFGYFVVDGVEFGVYSTVALRGSGNRRASLGLLGEYNFDMGGPLVPHIGIGMGCGWSDFAEESDGFFETELWAGGKYFFLDTAAFGLDLALVYASADVYNGYDDALDWLMRINTRWFF